MYYLVEEGGNIVYHGDVKPAKNFIKNNSVLYIFTDFNNAVANYPQLGVDIEIQNLTVHIASNESATDTIYLDKYNEAKEYLAGNLTYGSVETPYIYYEAQECACDHNVLANSIVSNHLAEQQQKAQDEAVRRRIKEELIVRKNAL